jgi:hypothetical protein
MRSSNQANGDNTDIKQKEPINYQQLEFKGIAELKPFFTMSLASTCFTPVVQTVKVK